MTPPYSMLQLPCCCVGGFDGGDPCFPNGIEFKIEYDNDSLSGRIGAYGNYSGGSMSGLQLSTSSVMRYTEVGGNRYWEGEIAERYEIDAFSVGLSDFDAISVDQTWTIRMYRIDPSTPSYVFITGITGGSAGNWQQTLYSNNDDGYIVCSRSSLFDRLSDGLTAPIPVTLTTCPILPYSRTGGFSIYVNKVYHRDPLSGYVTRLETHPGIQWTWPFASPDVVKTTTLEEISE